MLPTLLKPKKTFISVAAEIVNGLEDKSVYLNDRELEKAGYEIHEIYFRSFHLMPSQLIAVLFALALDFLIYDFRLSIFNVLLYGFVTVYVTTTMFFLPFWMPKKGRKKRIIIKK